MYQLFPKLNGPSKRTVYKVLPIESFTCHTIPNHLRKSCMRALIADPRLSTEEISADPEQPGTDFSEQFRFCSRFPFEVVFSPCYEIGTK
ncbi:hypothetical protein TNCV_4597121 [Trichonephila clavipes]|uniref:Uncharacterized protein n=1 Tax=Trichonephila clavipes TaxID=2585209 RepID=A0A8X6WGL9_TRICX|nr:hypothetical protein TNCV_4597121 [Trichonephila clavipes]